MIRYGAVQSAMRPMISDDLLISRLKLLVIMAKAYLKGYPLGDFRRNAVTGNARHIFYDTLNRSGSETASFSDKQSPARQNRHLLDHLFLQRAQLLAVMLNASVKGKSKGNFRNKAMAENIDHLCEYMADRFRIADAKFLKVA